MSDGKVKKRTVSVVIPVGRVDEDLPLQLEALAAQSFNRPWELVLSLNSDEPAEQHALQSVAQKCLSAAEECGVVIVDSSGTRSASHARNVGAESAQGELLLFCDGDDIADADWMTSLVSALDEGDAVGGFLAEDLLAVPGQEDWRPPATPGALPTFLGFPFLVSANMGIVRSVFRDVGGFDTTLIRGEDIALSWDLIERGVALHYAPQAVIHYRHRRGMLPMMKQHYLYGRGFSQILARRGVPGGGGNSGLSALKPNSGATAKKNLAYFARRGSIAVGRVVGLAAEQLG